MAQRQAKLQSPEKQYAHLSSWVPQDVLGHFISACKSNIMHQNVLEVPSSTIRSVTQSLSLPIINSSNLYVDMAESTVSFSISSEDCGDNSMSSIRGLEETKLTFQDMRTFAQDFTFAILTSTTDVAFRKHFPLMNDGWDNKTPDLIYTDPQLTLVLEFATSRAPTRHSLRKSSDIKRFKYEDAIRARVAHVKSTSLVDKRYCFSTIVCNETSVLVGSMFDLPDWIINEICARYRLALNILDEARSQGMELEETDIIQMKTDLLRVIESIPIVYESTDSKAKVPFTQKLLDTRDVDPCEAESFMSRAYLKTLSKGMPDLTRTMSNLTYDNLLTELRQSNIGSRMDKKSVIQLPSYLPPRDSNWIWSKSAEVDDTAYFINRIIEKTMSDHYRNNDDLEELKRRAMMDSDDPEIAILEKNRRKWKRVNQDLTDRLRVDFAKVGVQAKEQRDNVEVAAYRLEKKDGFSLDVETGDILDFLTSDPPLKQAETSVSDEVLAGLILQASSLAGSPDSHSMEVLRAIQVNDFFAWGTFVSTIGAELCISLKQNVNRDEWVVKKLREWDAYLIIKPTNSESHIFYMLVMPLESAHILPDGVFKEMTTYSNYLVMDFTSYSLSKLVNLVKSDSFIYAMLSQWSRYYGLPTITGVEDKSVWFMTRLMTLVHLEDKARTEEIMTLFRYISMEKFSLVKTDCKKMLSKIPSVLRSRLQVWVTHCMLKAMADPNYDASVAEEDSDSPSKKPRLDRHWLNMINPYTRDLIHHPSMLIELYYAGYATNKDAKSWQNTEFDLVKKIIQYEDMLSTVETKYCGLEDRDNLDDYQFHEWSRTANCASADYLKKHLKNLYGAQYESRLTEKIIHRINRLTWDQVATLKASSQFDPAIGKEANVKGKFTTKRVKVIIAVLRNRGELGDTPGLSIAKVLDWVDRDGGLRVDIFKKNQHGGLREIYVLELRSRILQLILEEISRTICLDLPIEMMMHPENKMKMPQNHMYNAATKSTKYRMNISSSNDAKVWNQGHHVGKFAQFLCRLLPSNFHGLIIGGLKQWLYKRIALPDGVLNFLVQHEGQPLYDEWHTKLQSAYYGLEKVPWMSERSTFLSIESGMMQGILHYTSSLYHSGLLMIRNALWMRLAQRANISSTTTDMVSSDDSSRMTDVFSRDRKQFWIAVSFAKLDHLAIRNISPLFGIWISPKSTMCTNGVMEFNSEFFFRASVYRPTLKWSLASLGVVEVESLLERQEVMYNQITELLEGGAGFRQAADTQVAQAILHYRLLGWGINPLFNDYAMSLSSSADPALGFFLLDHPIAAGLSGFTYCVWNAINNHRSLNRAYANLIRQGELSTTTNGQLTRGAQIRYGNRKKIQRLLQEATEVNPGWADVIEEDPSILYSVARTLEHSLLKIMVKLTSPSVVRSIARGNSIARMVASAVYLINGVAVTLGSNWMSLMSEEMSPDSRRVSLWRLAQMNNSQTQPLSDLEMQVLFPHKDHYRHLHNRYQDLSTYRLSHYGSRKMLRSHVQVYPENPHLPIDLESSVRWRWFGERVPASNSVMEKVWEIYRTVYPWLKDNPKDTISNPDCHFDSQIQLRNFIARQTTKSRSVHLTGSPVRDTSSGDLLIIAILKNQLPGYTLVEPDQPLDYTTDVDAPLQSTIASILTFPFQHYHKVNLISEMLLSAPTLWSGGISRPPPRKLRLSIIQSFMKLKTNQMDPSGRVIRSASLQANIIKNLMKQGRCGIYGGFKVRQSLIGSNWSGTGEWFGVIGDAVCAIIMKNSTVVEIMTNSIKKLRQNEHLLEGLLRECGAADTLMVPHDYTYKGGSISWGQVGTPVSERLRDQSFDSDISMSSLFLRVSETSMRLMCAGGPNAPEYTLVAYTIHPTDFRFPRKMMVPGKNYLLQHWVNNESIPGQWGVDLLKRIYEDPSTLKRIHAESFKAFVGSSLLPSLMRAGLDLTGDRFATMTVPIPEVPDEYCLNLSSADLFEPLEGDIFSMIDEMPISDQDDVEPIEYSLSDFLLGDLPLESYRSAAGDIRRVHRLWDAVAETIIMSISRRDLHKLKNRQYVASVDTYIKLIEYYTGIVFEKTETPAVISTLPSVEEEI